MDETFAGHFDSCLGCMSCVTACPSGVQYDQLLESVRPQIERLQPRTGTDRLFRAMIFALFPHPARLRVAALAGLAHQRLSRPLLRRLGLLDRLPARLRALEALLPPVRAGALFRRAPEFTPAQGERRASVALLTGCAQRVFFSDVNAATIRVLSAEGCDVHVPTNQRCCGALSMHAGRENEGLARARELIDTLGTLDVDHIVTNVAGCGSNLKEYATALRDDPDYAERAEAFSARARDVSELLAELGPAAPRHPVRARVAYHDACHLAHAQQVRRQPREMLRTIPELDVVDIAEWDMCCGSAGIYNLVQPEPADELGRRKVDNILRTDPDLVATGNAGCLLQIRRHLPDRIAIHHPISILDASIRGVEPELPVTAAGGNDHVHANS